MKLMFQPENNEELLSFLKAFRDVMKSKNEHVNNLIAQHLIKIDDDDELSENEEPKRGRGRPRKTQDDKPSAKRPVGRPKGS